MLQKNPRAPKKIYVHHALLLYSALHGLYIHETLSQSAL